MVHHTGKNPSRKERGNTAFRGAADTVMELGKPNGWSQRLECEKQKDWEPFVSIGLTLRTIQLADGQSSCVFARSDSHEEPAKAECGENDTKALEALKGFGPEGATYTGWLNESSLSKSTFKNARKRLTDRGLVLKKDEHYRVADAGEGQGQGQGQSGP